MERPTASSRLGFHRTGPRYPTPVYVHDDDDDDDDDEFTSRPKMLYDTHE
jgi:hypothetical protein